MYLLKNCKHCKPMFKYLKDNPNVNICLIMISKKDIPFVKYNEPRINEFPVAFTGSPKINGLPHKKSKMISGSNNILRNFINKFGTNNSNKIPLLGSNIVIDYKDNTDNIGSLNNIRKHRNNCFGGTCHVMDRPYGPSDNQFILQGFQPSCAIPLRSDLPIKNTHKTSINYNNFGMTTPGTKQWQLERQPWPCPQKLIDNTNYSQNLKGHTIAKMNSPSTFSNDYINKMKFYDNSNNLSNNLSNNFGIKKKIKSSTKYLNKFITAPVNSTKPFLTYAAGGNGVSRITGENYLREQVPIERQITNAFISGNLKNYADRHTNSQHLLSGGFNSGWSINGQGIKERNLNHYGRNVPGPPKIPIKEINKNPYKIENNGNNGNMVQTAFDPSGGNSGIAHNFYKFPKNGNVFGKVNKEKKNKKKTYTSPLGIEITFD